MRLDNLAHLIALIGRDVLSSGSNLLRAEAETARTHHILESDIAQLDGVEIRGSFGALGVATRK